MGFGCAGRCVDHDVTRIARAAKLALRGIVGWWVESCRSALVGESLASFREIEVGCGHLCGCRRASSVLDSTTSDLTGLTPAVRGVGMFGLSYSFRTSSTFSMRKDGTWLVPPVVVS